jgi:hypothetical protein
MVMAANNISTLATKQLRQEAKLALAEADRVARNAVEPGRYTDVTADITQLPTRYVDDAVVDNDNIGGLKVGRPWAP